MLWHIIIWMNWLGKICSRLAVLVSKDFFFLIVIVLGPLVLLCVFLIFRHSFTLRQMGIIIQMFTVAPVAVELWERLHPSVTRFAWVGLHIRNWVSQRGWERLTKWMDKHIHRLERWVEIYILALALIAFFVGLLLQLLA